MNRNRNLVLGATLGKEDNGESESKSSAGCDTRKRDE